MALTSWDVLREGIAEAYSKTTAVSSRQYVPAARGTTHGRDPTECHGGLQQVPGRK